MIQNSDANWTYHPHMSLFIFLEDIYLMQVPTYVIVYFSFLFYSYMLDTSSTHETSLMSCF
jgi:hypothetical protein